MTPRIKKIKKICWAEYLSITKTKEKMAMYKKTKLNDFELLAHSKVLLKVFISNAINKKTVIVGRTRLVSRTLSTILLNINISEKLIKKK